MTGFESPRPYNRAMQIGLALLIIGLVLAIAVNGPVGVLLIIIGAIFLLLNR